ncbi:MAG TPA: histidine kinase [Pyrinomonadaceae bacterium]
MSRAAEESESKERVKAEIPWKSVGIGVVVWSIIGFLFAFEFYLSNYKSIKFISFWDVIGGFLREISFYAVFTPLLLKFGSAYPFEFQISIKRFFRNFFIHLVAAFPFAIICFFLQYFVYGITRGEICLDCFKLEVLLNPNYVHRGVIVYWGIILVGQGVEYFRRLNDEKVRVAQLSTQLSEAQLSALKMQIHPHFLFNTLNSIVGLIQTDRDSAEIMTRKLSDFLRITLKNSGEMTVSLEQEFSFIKTYLDIEKVRFQKRLTIEFSFDEDILQAKVPNLILQPLVENSIKHGISRRKKDGRIKISAFRERDFLVLEVLDNGDWSDKAHNGMEPEKSGVGLKNTAERLKQIYGNEHFFSLINDAETDTVATIKIPYRV